jgi:hypothetical protein
MAAATSAAQQVAPGSPTAAIERRDMGRAFPDLMVSDKTKIDQCAVSEKGHSRRSDSRQSLPVYPDEQTCSKSAGISQRCQQRTHAAQQIESLFDQLIGARDHLRGERYYIWDSELAGFGLRVEASGTKIFQNS